MGDAPTLLPDTHFPQLPVLTNALAMKTRLQEEFKRNHSLLHIHDLRLLQMRYKPGKKCEVCYELHISDLASGRSGWQILAGIAEAPAKVAGKFEKARSKPQVTPAFGPALHLLPDLALLLWSFPNDSHLPQLPRLLDPAGRLALLQAHRTTLRPDSEAGLVSAATELVKYAPFDRCTLRHQLHFNDGVRLTLYSKTYNDKTSAAGVFATMQAVWQAPVCQSGAFIVPRPLFCEPGYNTLFMSALQGTNVDAHLDRLDLARTAARVGAGLAGLQQCPLNNLPVRSSEQMLAEVMKAGQTIVTYDAAHQALLADLLQTMRARQATLPAMPVTPVHTGFRLSQCLLVEDRLAVIDFDDFQRGNPVEDAASFVAHLLYLPLRDKLTTAQSETAITHFCRGYAAAAPWGLPQAVMTWYTAAQLIAKQAVKCINLGKKDHARKVARLLELAHEVLTREKNWC
ncbi:MAG: aminoglycoside phosphotransferase family protein [candidate division KSB1 bacterium]|nr:aminoglycoside phosphotransferase family protein [candidate division KSB1 bacterium]MDZ7273236.1 aminoglycoside phosphotransferase family protein [candidate division KSB1 bacterium]MDZ7285338.1 aminoglycoside phosphotransferase family protein [candidate division KSB1 bacterium]MDZ7298370.1 aminoglycoside phosphotransferase family protein [candidate division KSB1 bacterium]MDZ7306448.1 aminoglycoside phosphotransferase family protein [candidate division KSB1 bacterium]